MEQIPPTASVSVYIASESIIASTFSSSDVSVSGATLSSAVRQSDNYVLLGISNITGNKVTVVLRESAFKFQTSGNASIELTISNSLSAHIGQNVGLSTIYSGSGVDARDCEVRIPIAFINALQKTRAINYITDARRNVLQSDSCLPIIVNADGEISRILDSNIQILATDSSLFNLYAGTITIDGIGAVIKIKWEGAIPYNETQITTIWELYLFRDGGLMLYVDSNSYQGSTTTNIMGATFSPASGSITSIYPTASSATIDNNIYTYDSESEMEDITWPTSVTLTELCEVDYETMQVASKQANNDEDTLLMDFSAFMSFPFKNANVKTVSVDGNSRVTIGSGSTKHIMIDNTDGASLTVAQGVYQVTNLNMKAYVLDYYGNSNYAYSTPNKHWKLFLFENGDIMIYVVQKGESGTNSFLNTTFNTADNTFVSFYRNNVAGTSWNTEYEVYDVTKHVV
jgi:hypothetical protein